MKTFDEWKVLGYSVIKGSKAHWKDGKALFSKDQVTRKIRRFQIWNDEYHWDLDEAFESQHHYGWGDD